MGPKKKGGKKSGKGKKGGKKEKKEPEAPPKIEELNEASKEFYLVQLRDMEKRLERYQKRCDELEVIGGNITGKFEQMMTEKKDIVGYLKKTLDDKTQELSDQTDRVIGLQQSRDQEKDAYDQQLQSLKTDFQEMKDKLTSDNMILSGKLASLEEFRVQREKLMNDMDNLDKTIKRMEEDHKEVIYQLERKQVVDKDRLKKEMVMRVNQVAAEFRKVSNKQMAETTKRTIRENVAINAQLSKMSDKTVELITENDEIKQKERKQKLQLDLFESTERELARKNRSQLKIIQMLTEKCKQLETELDELEARKEASSESDSQEAAAAAFQLQAAREENDALIKVNNQLRSEVADLKAKVESARHAKDRMGQVIAEAANAIKDLIQMPADDDDVPVTPIDSHEAQNIVFENLLTLLNSASALGVGPRMEDLRSPKKLARPASARAIQRGEITPVREPMDSTLFYHPGDLGIVPRASQQLPSKLDRARRPAPLTSDDTGDECETPSEKPNMVSVGVQTTSTPKAIFFADKLLDHMSAKDKLLEVMHNDSQGPMFPSIGRRPHPTSLSGKIY